jgi:acetylornithine deacetylase/succinyl-diaminopimelate desuccinylase-like protein
MASLSRQQLEEAVERSLGSNYEVLATDANAEDVDVDVAEEEVTSDVSSATLDAVRQKYEELLGGEAPEASTIEDSMTAAVLRPTGDAVGDDATSSPRVRVFSDDGDIVAEQG